LLLLSVVALSACKLGTPREPSVRETKDCVHDPATVAAPATAEDRDFFVRCNVTLEGTETITKRLIFRGDEGSGVTFDCNGATVDIRTDAVDNNFDMVEIRSRART